MLRGGVGLREGRDSGLKHDLRFCEVGGFLGEGSIANARFCGRDIGQLTGCEVDSEGKLILSATDDGMGVAELDDGFGEGGNGELSAFLAAESGTGLISADGDVKAFESGKKADAFGHGGAGLVLDGDDGFIDRTGVSQSRVVLEDDRDGVFETGGIVGGV